MAGQGNAVIHPGIGGSLAQAFAALKAMRQELSFGRGLPDR
jgi:hypothetical protein